MDPETLLVEIIEGFDSFSRAINVQNTGASDLPRDTTCSLFTPDACRALIALPVPVRMGNVMKNEGDGVMEKVYVVMTNLILLQDVKAATAT